MDKVEQFFVVTKHNKDVTQKETMKKFTSPQTVVEHLAQLPEDVTFLRVFSVDAYANVTFYEPKFKGRLVLESLGLVDTMYTLREQGVKLL
ncbi:hypothetical protein F400_gp019 [Bacillus phage BCD7]|uniref:Uncharacterized protein n=1 Tax=Bacillus phage BCD7 TaxID=1136534 RepID=J9PUK7_9CAUD|nr:hypothetical protein F400_gp019 [Bacillus phage BCD7]AEZ50466.1 hypothetical protein BCD7_0019 [Bacillus phage BCD7]